MTSQEWAGVTGEGEHFPSVGDSIQHRGNLRLDQAGTDSQLGACLESGPSSDAQGLGMLC